VSSRWLLGFAVLLFACGAEEGPQLPAPDPQRPDLIVLSIDTLRPDHLGTYGYARPTSPYLDELARAGTVFESAWSPAPWTLPSHATMLTGLLPLRHHAIEEQHQIDAAAPSIAVSLSAAGYLCKAAVSSIFVSSKYGFERGFDDFQDFGLGDGSYESGRELDAVDVFDDALSWAARQPDERPIFLFLHVYDVHYPYAAPSPWDAKFDPPTRPADPKYENYFHYLRNPLSPEQLRRQIDQYDEEIAYTDDQLRRFHETWLRERPGARLIVVSDHGEEFGERGSWGHAHTLYPEQLHVPWIVHGRGVRAQRVSERVGLEDLAPTMASLGASAWEASDGADLSSRLLSGVPVARAAEAARWAGTSRFRSAMLRWHEQGYDLHVDLARGGYALFDLGRDPASVRNLIGEERARAERMNGELFRFVGAPWTNLVEGTLQSDGALLVDGVPQQQPTLLPAGTRFLIWPPDSELRFAPSAGGSSGPWKQLGGALPAGDDPALAFDGPRPDVQPTELSPEEIERLRALGYIR